MAPIYVVAKASRNLFIKSSRFLIRSGVITVILQRFLSRYIKNVSKNLQTNCNPLLLHIGSGIPQGLTPLSMQIVAFCSNVVLFAGILLVSLL